MYWLYKWLGLLVFEIALFGAVVAKGQSEPFSKLEEKVYQLNNALKYNESQALLLPLLDNDKFSAEEKYQVAILLSYTYKRVADYQSTLQFLQTARQFAQLTPKRDHYLATVLAQEAFVYFDIHNYPKSDSLMRILEKANFRYIDLENKSKLVMQQGYLLFLNKQYEEAESTYDRAIGWLKATSPCDLPMIYVKKMQLYAAMNRMDLVRRALRRSTDCADSCGIIKYHIYAHEELLAIYKNRNDLPGIAATTQKLDTLNGAYNQEVKMAALHNQKETILLSAKDQKLKLEQSGRVYLTILAVGLLVAILGLGGWFLVYRRQKRKVEDENRQMKAELERYLALNPVEVPHKVNAEGTYLAALSERQRAVLEQMATGMSNKEIADKLCISENTVKYHIKNIYLLLEIKDRKDFLVNMNKQGLENLKQIPHPLPGKS